MELNENQKEALLKAFIYERETKICEDYGQRVQKSVFECLIDPEQWVKLRNRLTGEINMVEDSLRFYFLGKNWKLRVEHVGVRTAYDPEGPLLV